MIKINNKNFKNTLSKFATGVTIVTINNNLNLYGKTINSFTSLSLSPPLVLFSLAKTSSKLELYKKTKLLTINVLSKNQKLIAINFAKKKPSWKKINFFINNDGNPIIKNCVSNFECRVVDKIKKGDHTIFICEVLKVLNNGKLKPLIYFNSKYL